MTTTKEQYEQAVNDLGDLVESTTQLIDMHFTDFAKFIEDKNIGTLKAYRALLERHLEQVDVTGKQLVDEDKTFVKDDIIKIGSVFGVISKIVDRIGYIDYRTKQLQLDFSK